jgi:hypothetical protein
MAESPKGGIVRGLLLWALSRLVAGSPHRQTWVRRRRVVVLRLLTRTRVACLRRVAGLLGRGVAGLSRVVGRLGRVARCGERMAPTWKNKVSVFPSANFTGKFSPSGVIFKLFTTNYNFLWFLLSTESDQECKFVCTVLLIPVPVYQWTLKARKIRRRAFYTIEACMGRWIRNYEIKVIFYGPTFETCALRGVVYLTWEYGLASINTIINNKQNNNAGKILKKADTHNGTFPPLTENNFK